MGHPRKHLLLGRRALDVALASVAFAADTGERVHLLSLFVGKVVRRSSKRCT